MHNNVNLYSIRYASRFSPCNMKEVSMLPYVRWIGLILSMSLLSLLPKNSSAEIHFEDVSEIAGVYRWDDSFGASWGDFNGDGWPDLWVGNHGSKPCLFLNQGDGTFKDITAVVRHDKYFEQHGAAWADFDNDGDQDLIVVVGGALEQGVYPNQFYTNSGGLLLNKAADYGLEYPLGRGRTPFWFDWNSDGYLDVFISNINREDGQKAPSVMFTRQANSFRNDNEVTIENGLGGEFAQLFIPNVSASPAVAIHGYPYPGKIYQYISTPFQDITGSLRFPTIAEVHDVAIADFNNDLLNDFFLVTANRADADKKIIDHLLVQNSKGFMDYTIASGLTMPTSCWSVSAADFDNDMDIDLYLVCSHKNSNTPDMLYENQGDGTFKAVTAAGGAEGSSYGRGDSVAIADYNNDGFIDLFVTNRHDGYNQEYSHNYLYRNLGNSNHWIGIELEGVISNRDGIGSLLLASTKDMTQMRVQGGGIHRVSQDHQRIHFGLGKNTSVKKLTIKWPSSIVQEIRNIAADQIIKVVELDMASSAKTGLTPLKVKFTSNVRGYYKADSYKWDFDNNGTVDSTVQNPTFTYNSPGLYTVKLTLNDRNGNTYTSTRNDYIKVTGLHAGR